MFQLLMMLINYCYFFVLHVCKSGSFPKPLTKQEETEYLKRVKEGDIKARNKLVEHNLRLVAHIIKKYYATQTDHDDLVSIGTIGLIKAINTFDSEKNIKLSSYASRCIENEILMHFRSSKKTAQDVSLNEAIDTDKDGNPLTLIDILSFEVDFADELDLKIKSEKLSAYLKSELNDRERKVIVMRYGLDGRDPLTQREVAERLKISRSYISRIEKKALSQLRKKYENS
ncbi:MAG: sigma-70 family RNA polymerase sigma factor [Ruminococcaceae bacterium]|nr:sigma-70 family RNA polymerase sigma factor [Oscillospiraceae bacterium]